MSSTDKNKTTGSKPFDPAAVQVGDVIQTRKAHPCGSDQWRVYRIGADIGLRCLGCDHLVMLPYRQFARAMKKLIAAAP
ncbi:MAG: DUF951 domain-containing protein [Aggregatilineales bacterium]